MYIYIYMYVYMYIKRERRDSNPCRVSQVPCNFGSIEGSSNCDSWFAPNVAPGKQNPPMQWPPLPLEGHPDGPSVIAKFCGPSCMYVGYVPELPISSRHARRMLLEQTTEALIFHGREMQVYIFMYIYVYICIRIYVSTYRSIQIYISVSSSRRRRRSFSTDARCRYVGNIMDTHA